MAGPAAVIVAGIFTMTLAYRTEDGLVADDYYKQGLAINKVLRRDERARKLGLHAIVSFTNAHVRVALRGQAPAELRLQLVHPVRAGKDQLVVLRKLATDAYEGSFAPSSGEARRLVLEDASATWRLSGNWNGRDNTASLAAER